MEVEKVRDVGVVAMLIAFMKIEIANLASIILCKYKKVAWCKCPFYMMNINKLGIHIELF